MGIARDVHRIALVVAWIVSAAGCASAGAGSDGVAQGKPLFLRDAPEIFRGPCLDLARAAARADRARIDALLGAGTPVDCKGDVGTTPLYWAIAARKSTAAGVDHLLASGADPDMRLDDGTPYLHIAAMRGDLAIVDALLRHGAHVDAIDKGARTAIYETGADDATAIVRALLAAGAKIDHRDSMDNTPLMALAAARHFEAVQLLLQAGADWRAQAKSGDSLPKIIDRMPAGSLDERGREYPHYLAVREWLAMQGGATR